MRAALHLLKFGLHLVDELGNDLRFALRGLRKHILVSVTVVLTLGFGLGLNTGVFTLINAALFRAYVDKDPSTFFRVLALYSDRFVQGGIGLTDYEGLREGARSVRDLAAWDDVWTTLGTRAPTTIRVARVSCNFFSVYGLDRPELGRLFFPSECSVMGSGPVNPSLKTEVCITPRLVADRRGMNRFSQHYGVTRHQPPRRLLQHKLS